MKKQKILITGGLGFIGYNLALALKKKGHKIIVLDNFEKQQINLKAKINNLIDHGIKFKKYNLIKPILYKDQNIDLVFNLAAILGVKKVNDNPYKTLMDNIIILSNVIDFVKKNKKCRLINFSSSETYSNSIKKFKNNVPTSEQIDFIIPNKITNRDSYGISKIMCEKMCQLANISYLNLRPHNIYGPDMGTAHVIPELVLKMISNKTTKIVSFNHKRCFCYIDDAIKQILFVAFRKNLNNQTINIGNSTHEITILNLAKKINKFLGKKNTLIKSKKKIAGSPNRRVPDTNKIFNLGLKQKFTSLEVGLKNSVDWYNANYL